MSQERIELVFVEDKYGMLRVFGPREDCERELKPEGYAPGGKIVGNTPERQKLFFFAFMTDFQRGRYMLEDLYNTRNSKCFYLPH